MDTAQDLVEALIDISLADNNLLFVDGLINDARKALRDGTGSVSSLVSTGLNGKSFSKSVHLSPLQVLRAAQKAKKIVESGEDYSPVVSSYPNFNFIAR